MWYGWNLHYADMSMTYTIHMEIRVSWQRIISSFGMVILFVAVIESIRCHIQKLIMKILSYKIILVVV